MGTHERMWRSDIPLSRSPLKFFLFSSRPHWKSACIAIVFSAVGAGLSASVALVFKFITDAAIAAQTTGVYDALFFWTAICILVLGVAKIMWRSAGFAGAFWATGASATARYALSSYVTLHSRAYFSDRFAGSIMNKIRHAATGMREVVDMFLWEFLELAVNVVVSFAIAWLVNPLVALIFLLWVLVMFGVNLYLGAKRVPLAAHAHDLETRVNGATVDLLANVSAMQEYARREFEVDRLRSMTEERRRAHMRSWNFGEWTRVVNSTILVVFGGAMAYTTVALAEAGSFSGGDVVFVMTMIFRIEGLLQSLGSNFNKFAETWGEIQESLEEIVEPHEIPDAEGATDLRVQAGAIGFRNVSFSYGDNTVFRRLNFEIAAGERVGLVGRSGAGKSSLIRLILRHYDLSSGTIEIDGTDIAEVTQESLRSAISIVPQEPLLFHRTIRENISYGNPDATPEEVIEAAKRAHAHDFIERLPSGYDAMVGERGVKLSGGERQRIAIARAILKNAPILILDEATSALDSESEVQIQDALQELMKGKTVIAIAHRLSTLREMDRILVMDQGKIMQEGTHDQLVKTGGIYAELWSHQAGGFLQDK